MNKPLDDTALESAVVAQRAVNYVREDRIHKALYSDPEIFQEELNRVFSNTWIWLAHDSEVSGANNYKTAKIGRQPVIVVKDRKGKVSVLLNRCRHRGATVCEGNKGKTRAFSCPYHGWSYGLDGSLRALPKPEEYENILNKADFGLVQLRHESYQGMIFATLNDDIEPLQDFLGGAKKWINLFMKQGAGYPLKVLGDQRFRFPGNWKIQLENTTDAYHFPIVHKSFLSSMDDQSAEIFDFLDGDGFVEDLGNGHSVMVMIPGLVDLEADLNMPIPERFAEFAKQLSGEGYSNEQVCRLVRAVGGSGFNLNLFPNISCSMAFFRNLVPVDVDETEIHHIAIGGEGAPDTYKPETNAPARAFPRPHGFRYAG